MRAKDAQLSSQSIVESHNSMGADSRTRPDDIPPVLHVDQLVYSNIRQGQQLALVVVSRAEPRGDWLLACVKQQDVRVHVVGAVRLGITRANDQTSDLPGAIPIWLVSLRTVEAIQHRRHQKMAIRHLNRRIKDLLSGRKA